MASLTKIVSCTVHNNRALDLPSALVFKTPKGGWRGTYPQDAFRPDQLDVFIHDGPYSNTLAVRLNVSQITNVSFTVVGCTVALSERVEMRSGRGASVAVVTKFVDVHSTLGVGVIASNIVGDGGRRRLALLSESNGSRHSGVST